MFHVARWQPIRFASKGRDKYFPAEGGQAGSENPWLSFIEIYILRQFNACTVTDTPDRIGVEGWSMASNIHPNPTRSRREKELGRHYTARAWARLKKGPLEPLVGVVNLVFQPYRNTETHTHTCSDCEFDPLHSHISALAVHAGLQLIENMCV